jgi:hypothetical protein
MMPRSQVMNWLMSLPLDAVIAINQDGLKRATGSIRWV